MVILEPVTKNGPVNVQHAQGTGLTCFRRCKLSSCSGGTEIGRPLSEGLWLPPRIPPGTRSNALSRAPKHTLIYCANSQEPAGYRDGAVVHGQDETTLFFLNPRFDYRPNSPLQYSGIDLPRETEKRGPPIFGSSSCSPF